MKPNHRLSGEEEDFFHARGIYTYLINSHKGVKKRIRRRSNKKTRRVEDKRIRDEVE